MMDHLFDSKHEAPNEGGIVFFGDSDIEYWGDLDDYFPGSGALNCGVSGATFRDVVAYTPRMLQKYKPRLIVCVAGENDLAEGVLAQAVADMFKQFCDLVATLRPQAHVIYISTKDEPCTKGLQPGYRKFNQLASKYASSQEHVVYLDSYTRFHDHRQKPAKKFFRDGLHLSPEGYQIWADMVQGVMTKIIPGCCRLMDPSPDL
mmetsp:Transcript_119637/g.208333  ORF Transcript_119637/g.208333 Transcript_119637/m.208333 type:complete len:204 (-) Transcript_119637:341-952(-)